VGVFVNQDLETILEISGHLKLDILQLHGTEGVEMGRQLKKAGYPIWKVFGLGSETPDWKKMEPWLEASDAFLFDTQSPAFGGTGQPFDHQILESYPFEKPFLLSGGIGPDFRSLPARMENLPLLGFDINSRFESQPGVKKVAEVSGFIEFWRSEKQ
jgi:phosphoribosylanthranilate isomerase